MSEDKYILDAFGRPLYPVTSYEGANRWTRDTVNWRTLLRSPDVELLPEWGTLTSRQRDLYRNYGYAAGAIQSQVDCVVGTGLKLVPTPAWDALGIDQTTDTGQEIADKWEQNAKARFHAWAYDDDAYCDYTRQLPFDGLLELSYRSYALNTEITGTVEWVPERKDRYATCISIFQPDLMCNPMGQPETWTLRGGVERDSRGRHIAHHFRQAHITDAYWPGAPSMEWRRVPTFTSWGRRQVIHLYQADQPGQTRGKPGFASVLGDLKSLKTFKTAAVQSAIINAMYAAVIESDLENATVAEAIGGGAGDPLRHYMGAQAAFHKDGSVQFDGAKIPHLLPGESLKLLSPQHPGPQFEAFENATLRHIAAGLNMSYEQLSRDYSKTNYSSARAAMLEAWRFFTGRRHQIAARFASQVYACWLEEAISRGDVVLPDGAPDFYTAKPMWCACEWIGPPRGHIDPLREREAQNVSYSDMGSTTLQQICAEDGRDWRQVTGQRAREARYLTKLGLPTPQPRQAMPPAPLSSSAGFSNA